MAMVFADPFRALLDFQKMLDSFRTSSWLEPGPSGGGAYPPINVFRKGDDIVIVTEVPGVKKEELRIEVKGRSIRIAGTKTLAIDDKASVHRRERAAGAFDRTVSVPVDVDAERVQAEARDGILVVLLPRAEKDRPRSITVS